MKKSEKLFLAAAVLIIAAIWDIFLYEGEGAVILLAFAITALFYGVGHNRINQ